jgi:hypothetical protein
MTDEVVIIHLKGRYNFEEELITFGPEILMSMVGRVVGIRHAACLAPHMGHVPGGHAQRVEKRAGHAFNTYITCMVHVCQWWMNDGWMRMNNLAIRHKNLAVLTKKTISWLNYTVD